MAQTWYAFVGSDAGNRIGPMSFADVKKMAENGQLSPDDGVWHEGLPEFVRAKTIDGLFEQTKPAANQAVNENLGDQQQRNWQRRFWILVVTLVVTVVVLLIEGFSRQQRWEYLSVPFYAKEQKSGILSHFGGTFGPSHVEYAELVAELTKAGNDGWELVGTFVEPETVHPNFGQGNYVTGLQPNVRAGRVVCIFKRSRSWFK